MRTVYLTRDDLRSINRTLNERGITTLTPDQNASGAYLINALERLPVQERPAALATVKDWLEDKKARNER